MKNKLILIEGIPGSGKTTLAKRLKDYFIDEGYNVQLYNEGEMHPADLAWIAYLTKEEYHQVKKDYPQYAEVLEKNALVEDDKVLVTYTKLDIPMKGSEMIEYLSSKDVYDGRCSLDEFTQAHLKRWKAFSEGASGEDTITIFECSYLQNHISELMGVHNKDSNFIKEYLVKLISTVSDLNPKLLYLSQSDVQETINRVSNERRSPDKEKWDDWIDLVMEYVESSSYGKAHNLKGFEGVVKFFEDRKEIELSVIDKLEIDCAIVNNENYNWDKVFEDIKDIL